MICFDIISETDESSDKIQTQDAYGADAEADVTDICTDSMQKLPCVTHALQDICPP